MSESLPSAAAVAGAQPPDSATDVLAVQNLRTWFFGAKGILRAVDGINFSIKRGEILCLVGESGCGKSVTALSIMGLVRPPGRVMGGGSVSLNGRELTSIREREYRRIRGRQMGMIFQDPMSSLNPAYRVGSQIAEAARLHTRISRGEAMIQAIDMMELVGIPAPAVRARDYPYQMSGGMRQRVMIAMALVCKPKLLIADEPTTALDVTIQAQILELLQSLRTELNTSMLLITHDFGVVASMADRVGVMYAGKIVESGSADDVLAEPKHPYTRALLRSVPVLGMDRTRRLQTIPGSVPRWTDDLLGCRFASRCDHVFQRCHEEEPDLLAVGSNAVACWLHAPGTDAGAVQLSAPAPILDRPDEQMDAP